MPPKTPSVLFALALSAAWFPGITPATHSVPVVLAQTSSEAHVDTPPGAEDAGEAPIETSIELSQVPPPTEEPTTPSPDTPSTGVPGGWALGGILLAIAGLGGWWLTRRRDSATDTAEATPGVPEPLPSSPPLAEAPPAPEPPPPTAAVPPTPVAAPEPILSEPISPELPPEAVLPDTPVTVPEPELAAPELAAPTIPEPTMTEQDILETRPLEPEITEPRPSVVESFSSGANLATMTENPTPEPPEPTDVSGTGDKGEAPVSVPPPITPAMPTLGIAGGVVAIDNTEEQSNIEASKFGAGLGAGLASGAAAAIASTEDQSAIEASKFNVVGRPVYDLDLSDVDQGLPDLPGGYGESRIVLLPRDPQWAYTYWDIPNDHKAQARQQGGQRLALRLYDVTDVDLAHQAPHSLQQYDCDELARDWYLPIPVSDRDYLSEIGYLTADGRWLLLARSNPIHVPPVYPSDWIEDQFISVSWEEDLRGKTLFSLTHPSQKSTSIHSIYQDIFDRAQSTEAQRVAGSLFGSMQHVPGSIFPEQAISSYVFPSGAGMWAFPTASGALPTLSGIGFSASAPPIRPRKFWLVADAELIVYGATEPDALVTIGGQPIQLSPDGTFRFQMSFQDGTIDYPILAVAADGEQTRSIHMNFERQTPERRTNTREEAQDEWLI